MQPNLFEPIYENKSSLTSSDYKKIEKSGKGQREKVVQFFSSNVGKCFSAEQVYDTVFDSRTPITSIRRVCTNLLNEGFLSVGSETRVSKFNVTLKTYIRR